MKTVNPEELFARIARDLPAGLRKHVYVVGSLAAARHHVERVKERGVKTKDADLVVFPSGNTESAKQIATLLLRKGWRPTEKCRPKQSPEPADDLWAIRLYPPDHDDYFIELLNVPEPDSAVSKKWLGVQLDDGWYGLPSFEFLGLTLIDRERADGLQYASPCMMALANLLSHDEVGRARMSDPIEGHEILRSAKDLGRAIALARLAGDETEEWPDRWLFALRDRFPNRWAELAQRVGKGFRALLDDEDAFEEARYTCDVGILAGLDVDAEKLRASAERLLQDVIEPVEQAGHAG